MGSPFEFLIEDDAEQFNRFSQFDFPDRSFEWG